MSAASVDESAIIAHLGYCCVPSAMAILDHDGKQPFHQLYLTAAKKLQQFTGDPKGFMRVDPTRLGELLEQDYDGVLVKTWEPERGPTLRQIQRQPRFLKGVFFLLTYRLTELRVHHTHAMIMTDGSVSDGFSLSGSVFAPADQIWVMAAWRLGLIPQAA